MEAGGGILSGVRGGGFSTVETVGWGFFTLLSMGMMVWVFRNTFVASIVRDAMNKKKREQFAQYRELAQTREHLHHHIAWCKQDGDHEAAERMAIELQEVEDECRRLAKVIGRKVRKS